MLTGLKRKFKMIPLKKNQSIPLKKEGSSLNKVYFGLNWGAIESKSWLGIVKTESVDLDASVVLLDSNKKVKELIYFGKLTSSCGSIRHSGDDRKGDSKKDDTDNETITGVLNGISSDISYVAFVLNSFSGHDFGSIPYSSIRLYEGEVNKPTNVIAKYEVSNDPEFKGKRAILMGLMKRNNTGWDFAALGKSLDVSRLQEVVDKISAYI
jgi:tellurium resistance protein TerZ